MDINGTKFHLLTSEEDWTFQFYNGKVASLWWDYERAALTITPKVLQFPECPDQPLLTRKNRRGAASDRFGIFSGLVTMKRNFTSCPLAPKGRSFLDSGESF